MKRHMLKLLIGSIVRWLLTSISVWLVAVNVFNDGSMVMFGLGLSGAIVALAWSQIQKLRTVFELDEALRLPERSSFDDLKKVIG